MSNGTPLASRPGGRRAIIRVYAFTIAGTLGWLAAIFLAPYLQSRAAGRAAAVLYALFAPVCHQIPGRSFFFRGFPLAVCGRCLGIYAGFLGGLALYPFLRGFSQLALPPTRLFLALSLPIGIDGAGEGLRLWSTPIGLRFATGIVWGLLLPFFFVTGVSELLIWRRAGGPARVASPLEHGNGKNVE
jgi:uncharacterized membrane protein